MKNLNKCNEFKEEECQQNCPKITVYEYKVFITWRKADLIDCIWNYSCQSQWSQSLSLSLGCLNTVIVDMNPTQHMWVFPVFCIALSRVNRSLVMGWTLLSPDQGVLPDIEEDLKIWQKPPERPRLVVGCNTYINNIGGKTMSRFCGAFKTEEPERTERWNALVSQQKVNWRNAHFWFEIFTES
jgi:hypothetical protein